jgi:hypothetical protein
MKKFKKATTNTIVAVKRMKMMSNHVELNKASKNPDYCGPPQKEPSFASVTLLESKVPPAIIVHDGTEK